MLKRPTFSLGLFICEFFLSGEGEGKGVGVGRGKLYGGRKADLTVTQMFFSLGFFLSVT